MVASGHESAIRLAATRRRLCSLFLVKQGKKLQQLIVTMKQPSSKLDIYKRGQQPPERSTTSIQLDGESCNTHHHHIVRGVDREQLINKSGLGGW